MEQSARMTAAPAVVVTERQRGVLLVVAVAGHALKHLLNAAVFVLLPEIKAGLGMSNAQVGAFSTVRFIAGGVANLPAGYVGDRFSRQRAGILGVAIGLAGVFALALGLAGEFWSATAAATLMIVAITFWHPSAIGALSREFAQRRGLAIGLHGTGGSVGEAVGPLVVGLLLGLLTWRAILQGILLPAVLCGGLIWLTLRTVPTRQEGVSGLGEYVGSMRRLLRNRRLLLVLLLSGGFSAGQSAVMTFLPIYLQEGMRVSPLERGFYLSLAQVAGIGTQPVMGYLSDRWGRKAVLVPGLTVLGLSYLGLALAPTGWPFTLVVLVMGAFLFSLMAIFLASASDLAEGSAQAATVSLVFGAGVVVAGVSPAVAGLIADAFGITAAFLWAAGAVLLTAFVAAVTRWQKAPA